MKRRFAQLEQICSNEKITKTSHYEFLYLLQNALLLALKEQGILNAMQYKYAEEKLKRQCFDRGKTILKKGESG